MNTLLKTAAAKPLQALTVTLNPAIDHTIEVPGLLLGQVNRARAMQAEAGGKGINVASCLADYGIGTAAVAHLGRANASVFEQIFARKGIEPHCLYADGMTRINTKLVDPVAGSTTDVNMPGPEFDEASAQSLLLQLQGMLYGLAPSVRYAVLAGSLPQGLPTDTYATLTQLLRSQGCKVLLDTSGEPLRAALATAAPHIIKPNRDELAAMLGRALPTQDDVIQAARALLAEHTGLELVVVSMGEQGALFVSAGQCLLAAALRINVVSTVGAGDAMVAGLIAALCQGLDLAETAKLATAFSAAKLERIGAHLPAPEAVQALARHVRVEHLD